MLLTLPTTIYTLISNIISYTDSPGPPRLNNYYLNEPTPLTFELRHQHAVYDDSRIAFSDYPPHMAFAEQAAFTIPSIKKRIPKPHSHAAFLAARKQSRHSASGHKVDTLQWHDSEIEAPDVTRRDTLLNLAKMSANSYIADRPTSPTEWYDIPFEHEIAPGNWSSIPHGWGPTEDGLRGHVFATPDNSTVVISIKGTSAGWLVGGGGPTVGKDKRNDNLLFSCCCARVGPTWSTVCDCYDGGNRCDSECLDEALKDEGLFYPVGLNLFNNVSYMYPNANIWMTGHSLGGGLASLLGITFGVPVVAFEAPAEKRAAERLHLPKPPSTHHVTHVYNTADPIPMGTCTGITSSCAIGGFALETRCHLGQVIKYDTVSKLGWSVDIRNHGIIVVIEKLLSLDNQQWNDEDKQGGDEGPQGGEGSFVDGLFNTMRWGWGRKGDKDKDGGDDKKPSQSVPRARPAVEVEGVDGVCTDCFNWEYGLFKNPPSKAALLGMPSGNATMSRKSRVCGGVGS